VSTGAPPPAGPEPPPPPPVDRHAPAAATVLVGTLLVLVGIAWLLDAAGVVVPWRAILPACLIAVGLACAAAAFRGRQHALMVVGVVLLVVLSLSAAVDWNLDVPLSGVGDRSERPTSPAQLREYELGVGNFELDLRQLQLPPGTTTVKARVGIGELVVEVPQGSRSRSWPAPGWARSRCSASRTAGSPAGSTPPRSRAATAGWRSTPASGSARSR